MSVERLASTRSRRGTEGGFTLIEVMIATAMTMIMLTVLFKVVGNSTRQSRAITDMSQQQADSRRALLDLVSDLRQAWTGDASTDRIVAADATTLTFYAPDRTTLTDISGQPIVGASFRLRRISYQLSGTVISRSVTFSTNTSANPNPANGAPDWTIPVVFSAYAPVLSGVRSTTLFKYRDTAGALLTMPVASVSAIKAVEISVDVDRIVGQAPDPDTFRTAVELRGGS